MICQNNLLVASLGTKREETHVIGVYFAAGFNPDVDFFGLDSGELAGDVWKGVEGDRLRLFICGPDAFAILGEVSFEGIHRRRAIPGSIGKGEARP